MRAGSHYSLLPNTRHIHGTTIKSVRVIGRKTIMTVEEAVSVEAGADAKQ